MTSEQHSARDPIAQPSTKCTKSQWQETIHQLSALTHWHLNHQHLLMKSIDNLWIPPRRWLAWKILWNTQVNTKWRLIFSCVTYFAFTARLACLCDLMWMKRKNANKEWISWWKKQLLWLTHEHCPPPLTKKSQTQSSNTEKQNNHACLKVRFERLIDLLTLWMVYIVVYGVVFMVHLDWHCRRFMHKWGHVSGSWSTR